MSDREITRGAAETLKEPEARVMTPGEILMAEHRDECVWLELPNETEVYHLKVYSLSHWFARLKLSACFGVPGGFYRAVWKDYGKTWRCWTAEPTAEQRLGEEWDG